MRLVKRISLLLALLVTVGTFTACSKFEYDNSTVMARVESIDGQKVVLLVGEMDFGRGMYPEEFGGGMGSLPDFGGESPNMEVPPEGEFPSGFEGMQRPEGEFPNGFEGMQRPEGELPEGFGGMQRPEGELPEGFGGMQIPGGQFPSRSGDMQMPFRGNGDQITLTLNEETVKALSVGSIVQITFGDKGSVESLIPLASMMGGLGGNGFGGTMPSIGESMPANTGS